MLVLGRRQLLDQRRWPGVLRPDVFRGQFAFLRGQPRRLADFIAHEDGLQRHGRLGALVRGNIGVQDAKNLLRQGFLVLQIGEILQSLMGRGDARLETLDSAKIGQEPVLQGYLLRLINNRLGLFGLCGDDGRHGQRQHENDYAPLREPHYDCLLN